MLLDSAEIHDGMGGAPIMVAENKLCEECGNEHEFEKCPDCGAWIHLGYGLAFGGMGAYKWCQAGCGWFYKELDEEE